MEEVLRHDPGELACLLSGLQGEKMTGDRKKQSGDIVIGTCSRNSLRSVPEQQHRNCYEELYFTSYNSVVPLRGLVFLIVVSGRTKGTIF